MEIELRCPECGSNDIAWDVQARTGMLPIYYFHWCRECGLMSTWRETEKGATASWRDGDFQNVRYAGARNIPKSWSGKPERAEDVETCP